AFIAIALLLAAGAVASAADLCVEVTVPFGARSSLVGMSPVLLVGRGFGTLPTAGTCKDFRGFVFAGEAVWAHGEGCGSSDKFDVSFFMPMFNTLYNQFGFLSFAFPRATLSGFGVMCTASTDLPGGCLSVNLEKVTCPAGVTVPEGPERCPGIC